MVRVPSIGPALTFSDLYGNSIGAETCEELFTPSSPHNFMGLKCVFNFSDLETTY